jgi:hypothetical protein
MSLTITTPKIVYNNLTQINLLTADELEYHSYEGYYLGEVDKKEIRIVFYARENCDELSYTINVSYDDYCEDSTFEYKRGDNTDFVMNSIISEATRFN